MKILLFLKGLSILGIAEFGELKEEDIVNLEDSGIEKGKKYIGTKAIIVKFDYNKVFDIIKKELSK